MTMRYAHLSADVARDAVRLLDKPDPSGGSTTPPNEASPTWSGSVVAASAENRPN